MLAADPPVGADDNDAGGEDARLPKDAAWGRGSTGGRATAVWLEVGQ